MKPSRMRLGRLPRTAMVLGGLGLYVAFFHTVYPFVGPATGAFYFTVVTMAGWLFGVRGGILVALGAIPASLVTYRMVLPVDGAAVDFAGHAAATMANLIIGYVAGRWSDFSVKNHEQRVQINHVERRHRLAVAATRDVIWEYNFKTGRAWYSDGFREMAKRAEGTDPQSFESWQELVHPDDRDRLAQEWRKATTDTNRGSAAYRLLCGDGSVLPVMDRFFIERDENGQPELAIGALADVSVQQRALEHAQSLRESASRERQLHQMNEFKTQLLNMASHELNTPISALRIQLFLLKQQMGSSPPPEMAKCFEILDRNTSRLGRLVADTLDVARIQNGRLSLKQEPCRISSVIEETLDAYIPVAQERGVQLSATVEDDPEIEADTARLTQVLFNLVSNAIKFATSTIRVTVRSEKTDVVVAVQDDGIGIPLELQDRLFLPFSQLHESSTAANRGNGLGLYISRNIVELHGGALWCTSEGPGHGSEFVFRLPSRATPASLSQRALVDPMRPQAVSPVGQGNAQFLKDLAATA